MIFTLSTLSKLCHNLEDLQLSSHQKEALINEIKNVEREIRQKEYPPFEVALSRAGEFLDPELLRPKSLLSKIKEQALSYIIQNSCPPNLFTEDELVRLQNDILVRYPRTWVGILLFKLGLYNPPYSSS